MSPDSTILYNRWKQGLERVKGVSATLIAKAGNIARGGAPRVLCGHPTLDMATGGGFVLGAVYLVHGGPGAGKSTLIGQAAAGIAGSVYISSEESAEQVASRFVRLGCRDQLVGACNHVDEALAAAGAARLVVIDSVSTMKPGVLEAGEAMVAFARSRGCAVVTVCHETKIGQHAGPRALEHLIDCTLALSVLDGEGGRALVVEKNRFGAAPQAYRLTMSAGGFLQV